MPNAIVPYSSRRGPDLSKIAFGGYAETIISMIILIFVSARESWGFVYVLPAVLACFVVGQIRFAQHRLMASGKLISSENKQVLVQITGLCFFFVLIALNALRLGNWLVLSILPFAAFGVMEFFLFRLVRRYEWG